MFFLLWVCVCETNNGECQKCGVFSVKARWCLSLSHASQKVDIMCKVEKWDFRASYRASLQTLPSPVVHGPESWSRGTAASDSRGHRDRQQTRQLRVLTLLFSIINEQESKQIRTKGGWGIPVCCPGVWRYRRGLTPTELLRCEVEVCFSARPLAWRNVTLNVHIYHGSGGATYWICRP